MACADLIRVPAESIWVEWANKPWLAALSRNGMNADPDDESPVGHCGMLIRSAIDGRSGVMRGFWSVGDSDFDVHASAAQARFYLDEPAAVVERDGPGVLRVSAEDIDPQAVLTRGFHFEFEDSWARYYRNAGASDAQRQEILHQIRRLRCALAVPVLLAFFLLLMTRDGLPQRDAARPAESRPHRPRAHGARRAYRGKRANAAPYRASPDRKGCPRSACAATRGCIMSADIWCAAMTA